MSNKIDFKLDTTTIPEDLIERVIVYPVQKTVAIRAVIQSANMDGVQQDYYEWTKNRFSASLDHNFPPLYFEDEEDGLKVQTAARFDLGNKYKFRRYRAVMRLSIDRRAGKVGNGNVDVTMVFKTQEEFDEFLLDIGNEPFFLDMAQKEINWGGTQYTKEV